MTTTLATQILIGASAALWTGWTAVMAWNDRKGDTISEVIRDQAMRSPMLPFAFGVLIGHWFWPMG